MSLALALEIARANAVVGLPRLGAVICDGKRVVSTGFNRRKSHPLAARYQKNSECIYLHAEISAIANAREDITGMTLYVARVLKSGEPALAMPCQGCARAVVAFGLNVEWTV